MAEHFSQQGRGSSFRFRRGRPRDYPAVARIAAEVFAIYGDYSDVLPTFLFSDEIITLVAEVPDGAVIGFLQVGLVPYGAQGLAADVVAIGVDPRFQGQGVGKGLFSSAFEEVELVAARRPIRAYLLTVAHTNDRAFRFFESLGFRFTGRQEGRYDGGQKALRMMRPCCRQGLVGKDRGDRSR